jgi:NAD(P) transhydrogenase subunit alpha
MDASPLYARNLYNFIVTLMIDKTTKNLSVLSDDELIRGTLITKGGQMVHPALTR